MLLKTVNKRCCEKLWKENNIPSTQLSMEVSISNLWKSQYKSGNAELGWIFHFDVNGKERWYSLLL